MALQKDSFCTLSDSGTITEEATVIGFPAINLRHNQERHEGMDTGGIIMTGVIPQLVISAIETLKSQGIIDGLEKFDCPSDYKNNEFSRKVIRLIYSYTHVVNKYTWYKEI